MNTESKDPRELIRKKIPVEWVDYNGHMNDVEYVRLFGMAVEVFLSRIGLGPEGREMHDYTIYTLETHVCYLHEVKHGETVQVTRHILDRDAKRIHLFLTMLNTEETAVATMELMLMGIEKREKRPSPFPETCEKVIEQLYQIDTPLDLPSQVGRKITIQR
ncbi:MAG: thioesterase family protein [Spirochaetaceae bacterium]|nr:thioesterase family protein [Spirochaetaceae bacterium]